MIDGVAFTIAEIAIITALLTAVTTPLMFMFHKLIAEKDGRLQDAKNHEAKAVQEVEFLRRILDGAMKALERGEHVTGEAVSELTRQVRKS